MTDRTILLVEDDPGHARLIERNLRRSGLQQTLLTFDNGQQVIDYLAGEGVYADRVLPAAMLIILDLNLPRLNGFQVMERLNAHPEWSKIPRIVMSTSDDPSDVKLAGKLGYLKYWIKPPRYEDVAALITALEG